MSTFDFKSFVTENLNRSQMEMSEETAFFERMSTFTGCNWTLKPRQVAPPVCAMYGWQAVKEDLVKCVSCNKVLSGRLPPLWKSEQYKNSVNALKNSIEKEAHDDFCPWPLNPSLDNFLRVRLGVKREAIADLCDRVASLIGIIDVLPSISLDIPVELRTDSIKLVSTRELLKLPEELSYETLVLAMTGWLAHVGKFNMKKLKCQHCFRIAEISFFMASPTKPTLSTPTVRPQEPQSPTDSNVTNGDQSESPSSCSSDGHKNGDTMCPPAKKHKFYNHDIKPFHPLKEHQSWCPWVDDYQTTPAGGTENCGTGWKILSDILDARLEQNSKHSDLVRLRERVLKGISSFKSS